jgi:hypothetical protein
MLEGIFSQLIREIGGAARSKKPPLEAKQRGQEKAPGG